MVRQLRNGKGLTSAKRIHESCWGLQTLCHLDRADELSQVVTPSSVAPFASCSATHPLLAHPPLRPSRATSASSRRVGVSARASDATVGGIESKTTLNISGPIFTNESLRVYALGYDWGNRITCPAQPSERSSTKC